MNLFDKTGKKAIGSRLRMLAAKMTEESAKIYALYQVELVPKWFPVFFTLSDGSSQTITDIAQEIGHSQPSVSKLVREMISKGILVQDQQEQDKRRNMVALSPKGKTLVDKMGDQFADIDKALDEMMDSATHNLWEAMAEWEYLLAQKSLAQRVLENKRQREESMVRIIPYTAEYQTQFKALNEQWIAHYFKMEESDYKALDYPQEYILDQGGHILLAHYKGEIVGTCALLKSTLDKYDFELAKMAVSPQAQGKHIGWLLGKAIIRKAQEVGASYLYLESNTMLKPAISLYHKLGFSKVSGLPSPYARCNIQMELLLPHA